MSLLVTGSIGIDTVTTPHGVSEDCIGGSSIYFSMAGSFFTGVRFVGVVGEDCPFDLAQVFADRNVALIGLEIREGSKTFRWAGTYQANMDDRITDKVELNVLGEAAPQVPPEYRDSKFVFLANTAPALQYEILDELTGPEFVAADTMNLWIENNPEDLKKLLSRIDCLFINEDEAKMLADEHNLILAAEAILGMGVDVVIIKKGGSGSILKDKNGDTFLLPAYPAKKVVDPTGAGDSFAGGCMGYIAQQGKTDFNTLKTAVAYGTVVASFTIADFSLGGLLTADNEGIDRRVSELRKITCF